MLNNAINAYQTVQKETLSGRETEARVLAQAACKLIACQRNWEATDRQKQLTEALKYNQRIWSIFQAEMVKEDNPLPQDVKRNILLLSRMIDQLTFDAMAFPEPEKLDLIISINQNIAAGLRGSPMGSVS